jgi:two-component system sensor kinase FixL
LCSKVQSERSTEPRDLQSTRRDPRRRFFGRPNRIVACYAKPLWQRVGAGAAIALAAALLRFLMADLLQDRAAYATFYPAVGLAALFGGLAAGATAAIVSAALTHAVFAPLAHLGDWLGLAIFLTIAGGIVFVAEALHRISIRVSRAELRAAEDERLRVTEERLRLAMSAGAIGAWDYDVASDHFIDASVDVRQMFGFAPETRIDLKTLLSVIAPDDRPLACSALRAALDPHGDRLFRVDYRIRRADDGAERWINARACAFFVDDRPTRLVGICRDVTDEKAVESLLAEKARLAEQFASVTASVPGVVCSFRRSTDGKESFPFVSRNFESICGVSPEEARADAQCVLQRVHFEDRDHVRKSIDESARSLAPWRDEFRYDHPEKGVVWLEGHSSPVKEANGDIIWHGYIKDVTEAKRAEQELRANELSSRALFDSGLLGIVGWKLDGTITDANDRFLEMIGYDRDDLEAGRIDWISATPPEYRSIDEAGIEDMKRIGFNRRPFEKEYLRKDGTRVPVLIAGVTLDEARTRGVAFVLDISERKRAEAQMQRFYVDRMNVMESMAAGIAHEINQPLTATVAYLKTARRLLEIEPAQRRASVEEALNKAAAQIIRAGQIVTRLREFIAHGEPDKLPVGLHQLILDAVDAAGVGSKADGAVVTLRLEATRCEVLADRVQIEQVLVNLIRNAEEAMSASPRREIVITTSSDSTEIRVAISDTGVGLSEKVKAELFQPFASTKASGMGVGLSICRAIIEAHHGRIWAKSNPEGGAVFNFALPLAGVDGE